MNEMAKISKMIPKTCKRPKYISPFESGLRPIDLIPFDTPEYKIIITASIAIPKITTADIVLGTYTSWPATPVKIF
jgi:hypothetical protein